MVQSKDDARGAPPSGERGLSDGAGTFHLTQSTASPPSPSFPSFPSFSPLLYAAFSPPVPDNGSQPLSAKGSVAARE
ncbi:hypothetical protein EYF80_016947 [Liparis tanakae]|uniref:Uncharacterized protein n=1 Tax=Liparis tanakae TaxID=230148 RepID=A0A4Z2I433_9TELE|nr:hypothetical protein EYF80_016947 [Liparis tanakae]